MMAKAFPRFGLMWQSSALAIIAVLNISPVQAQFASSINLSTLNGANGFRIEGINVNDYSGSAVSSAGDVNGDGFSDVIIGAYGADPGGDSRAGASYIIFGRANSLSSVIDLATLNGITGFRLDGIDADDFSGRAVAPGGDINGDGFGDVLIGALNADPFGDPYGGEGYVVFGKAAVFPSALGLSALTGANGVRLDGIDPADQSNVSLASAKDMNGDGFGDIIVGAYRADPIGTTSAGESYVIYGKGGNFTSAIDLGTLNGVRGFRLNGVGDFSYSGSSVASAGDINGDHLPDLVIGARNANPAGETYVVFGRASAFPAIFNLSDLNGTNGFKLVGIDPNDRSGFSVASAGDVNGDGVGDIIIGADSANPGGDSEAGESYIVFGRITAFPSILQLSGLNGSTGFRLDGIDPTDLSGASVASAGDINGDGFSDVIIGARYGDPHGADAAGESYVIFGRAGGFPSAIDLAALNGNTGFRLEGIDTEDTAGYSVASAGDVNGDGLGDVIVGAKYADPGSSNAGETYIVYGRPPAAAVTRTGAAGDQYISGGRRADTLRGLAGNDILEGRGVGDILDGGIGRDAASYAHAPQSVVASLALPSINTGQAAGDSYVSIENLIGTRFSDRLTGNAGSNVLAGGGGRDFLTGGGNSDVFRYSNLGDSKAGVTRDDIVDFNPGTSATAVDRIDLSAIDAKTGPGNQGFTFIGTAPFTGISKGQLRVRKSGTSAIIEGDVTGDHVPDFEIRLLNIADLTKLTSIDFIP